MAEHSHPHPHPHPQQQGPPPSIPANPALTALLDSLPTTSLPLAIVEVNLPNAQPPQNSHMALCPAHKQMTCAECGVDYGPLAHMHQFLYAAPVDAIPPPPNHPPPVQRAEAIKSAKEAGNTAFKAQQYKQAAEIYSQSANMALSRPPWEPAAIGKEEIAIALCNRSAAYAFGSQWTSALADAEAVIILRRPWTKGHFRKARALVGLNRLEDARDALVDGLQFEPEDKELNAFLKEIEAQLAKNA